MRVLAIETASPPGSVALLESEHVVHYQPLDKSKRTTEHFAVAIQSSLQQAQWSPAAVDLVAVCSGPGSFTGLRIGVTAAKTFAYAAAAEVLAVNTLELLASQVEAAGEIVAVLDAQRGQIFSSTFIAAGGLLQEVEPTAIWDAGAWLAARRGGQTITGQGLKSLREKLASEILVANGETWQPRADYLARLAAQKYVAGERQDFWQLKPRYYRKSAAEEKADRRN